MNILLRQRAVEALAMAEPQVQKAFIKQMNFLARDLRHPSLHAKKYDEREEKWQGRITIDRYLPGGERATQLQHEQSRSTNAELIAKLLVLDFVHTGLVQPAFVLTDHLPRMAELAARYEERRPDLADLCLIRISELHPKHPGDHNGSHRFPCVQA